jgi:hypothetical protein
MPNMRVERAGMIRWGRGGGLAPAAHAQR